ncbi:flagellin N-terminal helical domain-containing protein, partial [Pseudobutyrivibrio sp.]|uniref:flagellin N-terminal helical domain-containing protein n=1 Tax=Pseudobutyrivibrio sp. TaxID=2014367 RepID=UPI001B644B82|nr:flagellin [Pseudobutyrivibrio sp.]
MRINNNMSAVITNNQLLGTESSLADVMEKLSSGFSINHASDDPSGIAIAGKMQAQIDGLSQASTNSSDGISVLQTAEGALNEVTDMIQRMRELSVQAANGTNSLSERKTIQKEIDSLLEEIDRVAQTTEFNNIN